MISDDSHRQALPSRRCATASVPAQAAPSTAQAATSSSGEGARTPKNDRTKAMRASAARAKTTSRYIDTRPRTANVRFQRAVSEVIT